MASDESFPTLKILLIGPSGAGKSALLTRYCDDLFDSESSTATIGVDFKIKRLSVHGTPYRLNLLDTAGQERFRTLSNSYYRNAHGVLLVYDVTSRETFLSMDRWFEEAEANAIEGVITYLVGTKIDRIGRNGEGRAVKVEEGEEMARRHGCGFCEVSSKTRENVRKPFVEVVDRIVGDPALLAKTANGGRGAIGIGLESGQGDSGGSGCAC